MLPWRRIAPTGCLPRVGRVSETAGQTRRRRPDFSVDPHPGDRNVMDLNRQIDEEMGEDGDKE